MTSEPVELDIDAYGRPARDTALADLLELRALEGLPMAEADLADLVVDNGWSRLRPAYFSPRGHDPGDDNEDNPMLDHYARGIAWAQYAFGVVDERVRILGSEYPFQLKGGRLIHVGAPEFSEPYLGLLAISVCHASPVKADKDPKQVLEASVEASLRLRGFDVAQLAAERRQPNQDFLKALRVACSKLNLTVCPDRAAFRSAAHDEGVDVLSMFPIGDNRSSQLAQITQVTCGRSETWPHKSHDAAPSQWGPLLGLDTLPRPCLAVPHHIPPLVWEWVCGKNAAVLLLDRLRLAMGRNDQSPAERVLVETLSGAGGWVANSAAA